MTQCNRDCLNCIYDDCINTALQSTETVIKNRERAKSYYQKHREERLAYLKEYREKNRKQINEKQKEYYRKHAEEIRKARREYYIAHRAEEIESAKLWRKNNGKMNINT